MSEVQVKPVYLLDEFCCSFTIGRSKVFGEIRSGRLKVFKLAGRTVVAGEEAMRWRDSYQNALPTESIRERLLDVYREEGDRSREGASDEPPRAA